MTEETASPRLQDVQGTVLCIEDHEASMELVQAMLSGFTALRLLKAYTGQQGIQLAQSERPDLVLLDMRLPDISGLDVVRALNQLISQRALRVVLLTSDSFSIEVVKAMSLGAHEYWPKPLSRERIVTGVLRLLGGPQRS